MDADFAGAFPVGPQALTMTDTVAVTGGNGTIGRAAIAGLSDRGFRTVNVNRGRPDHDLADSFVAADLTDPGDVYGALAKVDPDAVVHLGMIPTPTRDPGHRVFESNAMSPYLVCEAAQGVGVDTVVLASSLCAMGAGYEPDPVRPEYLPVDESHPLTPSTAYGMGKQVLEVVADGVARRDDAPQSLVSLRFPWVTTPEHIAETFEGADRSLDGLRDIGQYHSVRNSLFSYLHVDDAVDAVVASVEADVSGHERLFLSAPDTTVTTPTADVLDEAFPEAERRRTFEGRDALISTAKAEELLDWRAERSWRD